MLLRNSRLSAWTAARLADARRPSSVSQPISTLSPYINPLTRSLPTSKAQITAYWDSTLLGDVHADTIMPDDLSLLDQLEEWLEAQVPTNLHELPMRMLDRMERMSNEICEWYRHLSFDQLKRLSRGA